MKLFGGQDMVSPIKKILIKHPQHAYINQSKIEKESSLYCIATSSNVE